MLYYNNLYAFAFLKPYKMIITQMEEIDLEYIRGKYLQIIENCVEFARKFLLLPHTIDYYFEE